jgi:deazaflavin-dependent oxidoreductase (nitroreductase family)
MTARERVLRTIVGPLWKLHVRLYELTGGTVGGRVGRAPVLLLTTTGRRSGQPRITPLLYLEDGERLVVVASNGGHPRHPAWFLNLESGPDVDVQVRRGRRGMRARRATPEERAAYWPRLVAMWPSYESYQRRTSREIPVVVLEPR